MEDPWNPCDPQHRLYMSPGEGTCRVEELACILRDRCPFLRLLAVSPGARRHALHACHGLARRRVRPA